MPFLHNITTTKNPIWEVNTNKYSFTLLLISNVMKALEHNQRPPKESSFGPGAPGWLLFLFGWLLYVLVENTALDVLESYFLTTESCPRETGRTSNIAKLPILKLGCRSWTSQLTGSPVCIEDVALRH